MRPFDRFVTSWEALPHRRRAILRYVLPLIGLGTGLAINWAFLRRHGSPTTREAEVLLNQVGWTLVLGMATMLSGVRRWPLQSLGLFALLFGIAGLFIRVFAKQGPQPVGANELLLIQAALSLGSKLLVLGLIIWFVGRLLGRGKDAPTNGN